MFHKPSRPESSDEKLKILRWKMVDEQVAGRGVRAPGVLAAMREVPRHLFIPTDQLSEAYADSSLGLEHGQTISQPYIVGLMTEWLAPKPGQSILEIGTGSGYQAAILASLGAKVYTLEIIPALAETASSRLAKLGYGAQVQIKTSDGFAGWPEYAPYDGILLACAVQRIPEPLLDQLRPGGRLLAPVGEALTRQTLTGVTKTADGQLLAQDILDVVFVPMTGQHGFGQA